MQKLYLILLLAGGITAAQAQQQPVVTAAKETLLAKESQYDFGKIPQGKQVTHVFELINTGTDSLQIQNVQASCGCTTPEWTKDPVAPGKSKKIKVGYNAAAKGPFDKTITVYYSPGKTKILHIKGEVWETPAEPAPANVSVQLLKNINH